MLKTTTEFVKKVNNTAIQPSSFSIFKSFEAIYLTLRRVNRPVRRTPSLLVCLPDVTMRLKDPQISLSRFISTILTKFVQASLGQIMGSLFPVFMPHVIPSQGRLPSALGLFNHEARFKQRELG
jgi:hypothetical protein